LADKKPHDFAEFYPLEIFKPKKQGLKIVRKSNRNNKQKPKDFSQ